MINRELIRTKVVQLVYAYVQNEDKSLDVAENELEFSLNKAYDLYKFLLSLMVEVKRIADRREEARMAREARLGITSEEPLLDKYLANNKLLQKMAENEVLMNYIEREKQEWLEEDEEFYSSKKDVINEVEREIYVKAGASLPPNSKPEDGLSNILIISISIRSASKRASIT